MHKNILKVLNGTLIAPSILFISILLFDKGIMITKEDVIIVFLIGMFATLGIVVIGLLDISALSFHLLHFAYTVIIVLGINLIFNRSDFEIMKVIFKVDVYIQILILYIVAWLITKVRLYLLVKSLNQSLK